MLGLPNYKLGDILECGEGIEYSKIQILDDNKVKILLGFGKNNIINIYHWYFINEKNHATIQNISDVERVYYLDDGSSFEKNYTVEDSQLRINSINSYKSVSVISKPKSNNTNTNNNKKPTPWYWKLMICGFNLQN